MSSRHRNVPVCLESAHEGRKMSVVRFHVSETRSRRKMLRADSNQAAYTAAARWAAAALCTLLLTSATALGQGSTTATIRGNVQDPSGGVLPGATVTVTNTGTKAVQTAVTDERGQYQFAALFPGTYDLRVEL